VSTTNPVPVRPANGVTPIRISFAAAETQQVKGAPGRVFAVVARGCDVTLLDGAGEVWFIPGGTVCAFPRPVECATSIQVSSSAAGSAYVQFE
jgi:hypothetical protein